MDTTITSPSNTTQTKVEHMPVEILLIIFEYLDYDSLYNRKQTCRYIGTNLELTKEQRFNFILQEERRRSASRDPVDYKPCICCVKLLSRPHWSEDGEYPCLNCISPFATPRIDRLLTNYCLVCRDFKYSSLWDYENIGLRKKLVIVLKRLRHRERCP